MIQAGKPVLVEKPTTTTLREFNELEAQSKQAQVPVICMFHYAPASEVVAAYPYLRSKGETHHAAFHATFYDPYNTNFDLENFSLMNSWIDHGINQLSVFFSIWPDAQLQLTHFVLTPPKGPQLSTVSHSAEFTFTAGPISGMVILESNWSVGLNYKTTRIHISNPNHLVELEHMKESVLIDGKNVEGLSFANDYPRLTNHYIQLFPKAVALIKEGKSNWEFARRVHEPLFQVLEQALG